MAKTQNSIGFAATTNTQFAIGLTSAGPNALDVNGAAAIGTYAGTNSAPSGGLIVSGQVAIGTSSAAKQLNILDSVATNTAQIKTGSSSATAFSYYGNFSGATYISVGGTYAAGWAADTVNNTIPALVIGSGNATSYVAFATGTTNNAAATETARFTDNQGLGIGYTTAPTNGLDVLGQTLIGESSAKVTNSKFEVLGGYSFFSYNTSSFPTLTADTALVVSTNHTAGLAEVNFFNNYNVYNANAKIYDFWSVNAAATGYNRQIAIYNNGGISVGQVYSDTAPPGGGAIFEGNVGIGTSSPTSTNKVQVGTNVQFTGSRLNLVGWTTTNGTDSNLEIGDDGGGTFWRLARDSSNNFRIDWTTTSSFLFAATTGGQTSFYSSSPPAEANIYVGGTWTTVSGGSIEGNYFNQTLKPASAATDATHTFINPIFDATTAAITTSRGLWINANAKVGANTITNAYSLYVADAAVGTTSNTALYADNIAVGFLGVSPPTNGFIIGGLVGIGTSSPDANSLVTLFTASLTQFLLITGTNTNTGGANGINCSPTFSFSASNGNNYFGYYTAPTFKTSTGTLSATMAGIAINNQVTGNAGTISTVAGLYVFAGSASAGTITTAYGGYFNAPSHGTNKIALYSDNAAIGYAATTPPSAGLIVSGQAGFGTSSPGTGNQVNITVAAGSYRGLFLTGTPTSTDGSNQFGIYIAETYNPTSGAAGACYALYSGSSYVAPMGQTIGAAISVGAGGAYSSNVGTITSVYGFYFDGGTAGAGTITTAYSMYLNAPTCASTNYGAYIAGSVGIGQVAPAFKLDVTGTFRCTGQANVNNAIQTQTITASNVGTFDCTSNNATATSASNNISNAPLVSGAWSLVFFESGITNGAAAVAGNWVTSGGTVADIGRFDLNSSTGAKAQLVTAGNYLGLDINTTTHGTTLSAGMYIFEVRYYCDTSTTRLQVDWSYNIGAGAVAVTLGYTDTFAVNSLYTTMVVKYAFYLTGTLTATSQLRWILVSAADHANTYAQIIDVSVYKMT